MTDEPMQFYVCFVAVEPGQVPLVVMAEAGVYGDRAAAEARVAAESAELGTDYQVIEARTEDEAFRKARRAFGIEMP